jgi:hypothetical protein
MVLFAALSRERRCDMRLATLTLAMLGLLSVGTTFAFAQEQPANVATAPNLTTVADEAVVTFVHRPVYRAAPGWYGYYRNPPYYTYRPRVYWYGPPRYYGYDVEPYSGYYYPNGFGFEYHGPRRSFSFGF